MELDARTIITGIFLGIGALLILIAAVGVLRFPDFYTRMHAAGKVDTLGQSMILVGLIVYEGFNLISVKLFMIIVFIYVVNPTAAHFITKAAYLSGVEYWQKIRKDVHFDKDGTQKQTLRR